MRNSIIILAMIGLIVGFLFGCSKELGKIEAPKQAKLTVINMPQAFVKGSAPTFVADLDMKSAAKYMSGTTIEVTLKNAKWNKSQSNAARNRGWNFDGLYDNNLTVRYIQSAEVDLDNLTLILPGVIIGPEVASSELVVSIAGTAGLSGDFVVGSIVDGVNVTADKPLVRVNALHQAAGKIVISEAVKYGFSSSAPSGVLKLSLPSGILFAQNPKVIYNDKPVDNIKIADGGEGKNYIQWQVQSSWPAFSDTLLEKIEVDDIIYNIDSRFTPQDIVVDVSGEVLTGPGGSTETIVKVANASARNLANSSASFVVGSIKATINGEIVTMDVAPYQQNGRVFLPIRYVANTLAISDSNIIWDAAKQVVTLVRGDTVVQMQVGSAVMLINGTPVTMDVTTQLVGDRVMLPISWIAQAFGAGLSWDEVKKTITLAC